MNIAAKRTRTVNLSRQLVAAGDLVNGALLAFHTLKRGTVAINGNTGAVLGRSLTSLRDLVDRTLSEVRLAAGKQRRERLSVTSLVDDIAATGLLHSEYRGIRFNVVPIDPALAVDGDPQLPATGDPGMVAGRLRASPGHDRVRIAVE